MEKDGDHLGGRGFSSPKVGFYEIIHVNNRQVKMPPNYRN
jgi:hypothetical protein